MKLSNKSEYAFLALIDLDENYTKDLIKSEEIAVRKKLPKKYLGQVLRTLKNSGYIKSKRGAGAGYRLAMNPSSVTLAVIVRLMDGPLSPVGSMSTYYNMKIPIEQNRKILRAPEEIRDHVATTTEHMPLSILLNPVRDVRLFQN